MEKTQHQALIEYLKSNPAGITTADYVSHPKLCAEFRARVSEARKKGYVINAEKLRKNLWKYTLVAEPNGELYLPS